jgi:hypothetical protein
MQMDLSSSGKLRLHVAIVLQHGYWWGVEEQTRGFVVRAAEA